MLAVAAAACISRFLESEGVPLCRDQIPRLVAIASSVCAKFWDEGAVGEGVNLNFASVTGIPLEDYNAMEISFLSSLGWSVTMEPAEFKVWAEKIDVSTPPPPSSKTSSHPHPPRWHLTRLALSEGRRRRVRGCCRGEPACTARHVVVSPGLPRPRARPRACQAQVELFAPQQHSHGRLAPQRADDG